MSQYFRGINDPVVDPITDPVSYPAQTLNDDLFGLSIWQPFGKQARIFARFTLLNGDANELHLRFRWFTKDGGWVVLAEWYQLFQRLFNVNEKRLRKRPRSRSNALLLQRLSFRKLDHATKLTRTPLQRLPVISIQTPSRVRCVPRNGDLPVY